MSLTGRSTGRPNFRPDLTARALDQRFSCGLDLILRDSGSGEEEEFVSERVAPEAGDGMLDKVKVEEVSMVFYLDFFSPFPNVDYPLLFSG